MVAVNRMSKFLAKRICLALKGVTVSPVESPMVSSTVSVVEKDGAMQKRRISAWKSTDLGIGVMSDVSAPRGGHLASGSDSSVSDGEVEEHSQTSQALKAAGSVPHGCHRIINSPEIGENLCRYHLRKHSSTPDCTQENNSHVPNVKVSQLSPTRRVLASASCDQTKAFSLRISSEMNSPVDSSPGAPRVLPPENPNPQFSFNVTGPPTQGPDWSDLNYPKGTKLFHYKPHDDLPINVAHRCNLLHANYLLAVAVLLLNIVDTIIVILAYRSPWVTLLYTFLNLIIFGSASFVVFYLGYLGLAMRSKRQLLYYKDRLGHHDHHWLPLEVRQKEAQCHRLHAFAEIPPVGEAVAAIYAILVPPRDKSLEVSPSRLRSRYPLLRVIISTNIWVWFYVCLKWIRIGFKLLWFKFSGRRLRPEERIVLFDRPPETFDVEWSRSSRLIGSYLRAHDPILARAAFPGLKTKRLPRTGDMPERLWVNHLTFRAFAKGYMVGESASWLAFSVAANFGHSLLGQVMIRERYEVPVSQYVVLYYIHGGYMCFFDGVSSHRLFVARIIDTLQKEVREDGMAGVKVVALIVNYTRAPEAILPTQLQEVVQAYRYILTQDRYPVEANRVVVSGDSSGGTLSLSLLKCLASNYFAVNLPRPGCCVAISPVVSLRGRLARRSLDMTRDVVSNAAGWYMASCALYGRPSKPRERMNLQDRPDEREDYVRRSGRFEDDEWRRARQLSPSGKPEENPLFSCMCGELTPAAFGNVPILVQAGGSEGLAEDIAAFAEATQGTVMLELYENMFHSFQQYSSLPQSQLALRRMARFVADAIRTPQKLPNWSFVL
ncbi:hypothetical protein FOZ60_016597 [Perkinsus olseni]|uniref:Alpha/beta hydrolase fold-3 domain-containing protein n=1 Tax=Perkinsus olseni TaxID=32597 RepID=A0A7J6PKC3_PEROL|nr:hypothetical protein FOZ60_016597 [Perkinsus olseni]